MSDNETTESAGPVELPGVIYKVTPALIMLEDGSDVDFGSTDQFLNEMSGEGWQLLTVDQGAAYWMMDVREFIEAAHLGQTCGRCTEFCDNVCDTFGWSVGFDAPPHTETCFKPPQVD